MMMSAVSPKSKESESELSWDLEWKKVKKTERRSLSREPVLNALVVGTGVGSQSRRACVDSVGVKRQSQQLKQ